MLRHTCFPLKWVMSVTAPLCTEQDGLRFLIIQFPLDLNQEEKLVSFHFFLKRSQRSCECFAFMVPSLLLRLLL